MDFRLTEEQQRLQRQCRELAADFATRSAAHDREASHPIENYNRLCQEGFLALTIAKEWGGAGTSFLGPRCRRNPRKGSRSPAPAERLPPVRVGLPPAGSAAAALPVGTFRVIAANINTNYTFSLGAESGGHGELAPV